ncbi:hypothetical protein [Streptomyces sp. ZSW22]|uniref:hypothetical protein n=1 Tax=Streptomyces sp. ZSW22 TaxID=3055050 RepID=UPI0025B1D01D|nr:hypothetical protein [Streptomyces sp. ZSW22]MDN3244108.1 hypothetical protein [Streptomyces sp. ZSW22]
MRIRRSRLTGDFLQVPNATVRDDRLSHTARGILVELLSRPDGWEATADDMWQASVAKHGKASPGRRVFRAAFAELKEYGYLTAGREVLPGGRYGTILTLTDVPQSGTSARPAKTDEAPGRTDVPHGGTSEGSTDVPTGGTSAPPAETGIRAGQSDVPPAGTSERPTETPNLPARTDVPHAGTSREEDEQKKTGKNTNSSSRANPSHHLEAFGAFWLNYPKRRAKEEARKAWIAAIERGVDPAHIVQAAKAYAHERHNQDPKYTKYPATWLNKGCYDDEPDPQPAPQQSGPGGDVIPFTSRQQAQQQDTDDWFARAMARAQARDAAREAQGGTA